MKKTLRVLLLIAMIGALVPLQTHSQSVAINADSSAPDPSAILDLKSTIKGFLTPRMTLARRDMIATPAVGLLIYQTDNAPGFYCYDGAGWGAVKGAGGGGADAFWSSNGNDISNSNSGNVGIGTTQPASKLEIKTPYNAFGFLHLGVAASNGTDSVLFGDYITAGSPGSGSRPTTPSTLGFGTLTPTPLQFHAGSNAWLNLIPDGNVVIGDSIGYHSYFGAKLAIKSAANTSGVSVLSDDGAILSLYGSATTAGVGTFTGNDMHIYANSTPVMTVNGSGYVGINAPHTKNQLQIGDLNGFAPFSGAQFGFTDGTNYSTINQHLYALWQSTTNICLYPNSGLGNVGINTTSPANMLEVGYLGFTGLAGNHIAFGNGHNASALAQSDAVMQLQSTTDITLISQHGAGHVGINSPLPVSNKLQIGGIGSSGFVGNDFAIGNGAQATAFNQYASIFQIASNTDMAIMPAIGSGRKLGINTTTPRAILDVQGSVSMYAPGNFGFAYLGLTFDGSPDPVPALAGYEYAADVSIIASNNIMALQFDAYSDARIKKIIGPSNSQKDLKTLNALQITDYTFKDKITYGRRMSKKVIAQQVEQVYPQIVSKHRDVVPNVFQPATSIEPCSDGYLLTFTNCHNISPNAKRLQVIANDSVGKKFFDVVSIPSPYTVVINATDLTTDKLFVYGEEVDDFRTVDYEGLTTLNISATQELSKELRQLQQALADSRADMRLMAKEIRKLKHPTTNNRLTTTKITNQKITSKQSKKI